ncbi:hypothetical protein CPJCM30710_05510 [Clostridium polyendosporum]|uniref:Sugar kinase of the NBD/HSP70 family, may contain an N-terminal HTH domain n=1 Tax=Clostridium polyendosporum TaxID=69208 RepID=A0A919VEY9_9CLOT|nr:ROK family protein [Clostridium polyendosporum]GIM27885.1 hypothetical protein CPJCM30710_05510 [Clostridium polyendosporum]
MLQITNNTIRVKQINTELVKVALKNLSYGTKLTIANATGLSVATCGNILKELLESGEVLEIELEQPNGGRPARRFVYNANYAFIACLYLKNEGGIYTINYAVTNLIGEIIEEGSKIFNSINYDVIDSLIGELIERYENIKAVGIGVPGVVRQGVIGVCDIKELINVPLGNKLKEKYQLEITIENDMNFTVYGFYKKQNYDRDRTIAIVFFPKGNFPGAGIIVDGHILKGNTKFAGELSFLPLDLSREEQLKRLNSEDGFIPLAVKAIVSIIAIINPETIALTGELFKSDQLDDIYNHCLEIIPKEHMPQIFLRENIHDDYMNGLISITLESLSYNIQLVEKRI